MDFTQITNDEVQQMLKACDVDSMDALFAPIPENIRFKGDLHIPPGVSELEILKDTETLATRNRHCNEMVSFLGAGAYDHFIPTLVDGLASQTEFLTAYTPYQAEASQGILQLFYEYQTMICQLTGMEVANASVYDFASGAAEAVLMATSITRRKQVIVVDSVHPDILKVLQTYIRQQNIELITIPAKDGLLDEQVLSKTLNDSISAVVLQSPNFFGCVERLDKIVPVIHGHGALAIVSFDPLAAGVLKSPGDFDVDIVIGEGQSLGIPLQYGGPYLGLLACREKYLRKMPGRVVGQTKDQQGRRGFCLTLQTREQHIKRERATSNICTNQGLLAIRAAIYMAAMGRKGIQEVSSQCFDKAHYAEKEITKLDGYELRFQAPFFKEFAIRTSHGVKTVLERCRNAGMYGGVPLGRFDEKYADCFLVAVTEKRSKQEIDHLVATLKEA